MRMAVCIQNFAKKSVSLVSLPLIFIFSSFLLSSLSIFEFPLNHDVSAILEMARRVHAGATLYVDIIEVNPPLIIWLSIPVALLTDLTGISAGTLFRIIVLFFSAVSVGIAAIILCGKLLKNNEWPLLPLAFYVVTSVAGYDFGQREHLAVIFCLPYISFSIVRLSSERAERCIGIAVAAVASVGFALKPHFLLIPLLIESLIMWRGKRRSIVETYVIGSLMSAYAGAIFLFTPEYFSFVKLISRVYGINYLGSEFSDFIFAPGFHMTIALSAAAWISRPFSKASTYVLSAAILGFACAAIFQSKGWSYHWYPAVAFSWLLFGISATSIVACRHESRPQSTERILGSTILLLSLIALCTAPRMGKLENSVPSIFSPAIKELGGGPVAIFSNVVRVSYPLVTEPGIGSSLSHLPTVVLLSAAIISKDSELEAHLREFIVTDIKNNPPNLIITEIGSIGLPTSFNFINYLSKYPSLSEELKNYALVRKIGQFEFHQRIRN